MNDDEGRSVIRRPESERMYADHLSRSRKKWNRWSDWYELSERDLAPLRESLIEDLSIEDGDRVLDVGCGPGVNFEAIRSIIGEHGELVGLDYSPKMVEQAEERVRVHGWDNVRVVQSDATTADLGGPYDAAVATLSLSIMPNVPRTLENIYSALRPGGDLGVLDVRPIPSGPGRILNPALRRFLRWYANWNSDADVPIALDKTFDKTHLLQTRTFGTLYVMRATRAQSD